MFAVFHLNFFVPEKNTDIILKFVNLKKKEINVNNNKQKNPELNLHAI